MTNGERQVLKRGLAAGILIGLAIGGMIALFIALRSGFFVSLIG